MNPWTNQEGQGNQTLPVTTDIWNQAINPPAPPQNYNTNNITVPIQPDLATTRTTRSSTRSNSLINNIERYNPTVSSTSPNNRRGGRRVVKVGLN